MYQVALIAIDLSENSTQVLQKAKAIIQQTQCDYQVVCCYEPLIAYLTEMSLPITSFDDAEMIATLKQRLAETVAAAGLDSAKACLIESVVGAGICQHAKTIQAEVIIIGSHGRSGLGVLIGSTTNYVLHHTDADVLAVRLS